MRDAIERVRRSVREGGLKKSALVKEAGLGSDVLIGIEREEWNPRAATLIALTDALDRIAARIAA
jgi:predicted transcriptional regulator